MKYTVGTNVRVVNQAEHNSGGNFNEGDVVTIVCIGCDDDHDCYGAISPHDHNLWYLNEIEVKAATFGDYLRSCGDNKVMAEEISKMMSEFGMNTSQEAIFAMLSKNFETN